MNFLWNSTFIILAGSRICRYLPWRNEYSFLQSEPRHKHENTSHINHWGKVLKIMIESCCWDFMTVNTEEKFTTLWHNEHCFHIF